MTFEEILYKFEDVFPFADVDDYRPICHELFTDGKEGITVWLKNGDIIEYYPNKERGRGIMDRQLYSVIDDNGNHIAYHMELRNALILVQGLMLEYYHEPCLTYRIMREQTGCEDVNIMESEVKE